ncbi:MAG: alkyldihydroxyacetonephosphate synthase, partial [Acidimicrobiaceae bacterium]
MTKPAPPIELSGTAARLTHRAVNVEPRVLDVLSAICPTAVDVEARADASRDWWPLAMHWALGGMVPQVAAAVCSPRSTADVSAVIAECAEHGIPVTAAGGRSGVNGASVPVFGGVVLDLTALQGIASVDANSGVVEVWAGTFGPDLEREL